MGNIVKINGTEFKVKNTLRAIFVFEQITNKSFAIETSMDNFLFLYSVILANNPDRAIGWDEFINALDEDKTIFTQMNDILSEAAKVEEMLSEGETSGDKKKE